MAAILTPRHLLIAGRLLAALTVVLATVLMLGPFQGLERSFGLSDVVAHAIVFYLLTVIAFLVAPSSRRTDLWVMVIGFGIAVEIVQGLTGRSASLSDLMADAAGATAALVPGLVERLRNDVRRHPRLSYRDIARLDRRRHVRAASAEAADPTTRGAASTKGTARVSRRS